MDAQNVRASAVQRLEFVDPDTRGWFRFGGISAIILGLLYMLITGVYSLGGALPAEAEAWLQYLGGHTTEWWLILGLSVLTDLLFLPIAYALFIALKTNGKNAMLFGCGLLALFVILDLAVTWPNHALLIILSGSYSAAASEAQRLAVVSAATYAAVVLNSILWAVYAILIPALGILVIALVMLKGVFNKLTSYSGLGAGIFGIVAVVGPFIIPGLGIFAVFSSILTTLWVLLLGVQLLRLGRLK